MKIIQYAAFALLVLSLAACNKPDVGDGADGPGSEEGKTGKLKLSFALPNKITTYAGNDPNSTEAEATISTVDVFVYEDGGSFALDYFPLTDADFARVGPGTSTNQYSLNNP